MYYQLKFNREFYQSVVIDVDELFNKMGENFAFLDATSRLAGWKAPHAMLSSSGDAQTSLLPAISDWLGQPVISPRAFHCLQDLLLGCAECLPLHLNDEVWFIVNVLSVEQIVDRQKSERGFLDGELSSLKRLVFDGSLDARSALFKITYDEKQNIFCGDAFKHRVESEGLSGLSFISVEQSQTNNCVGKESNYLTTDIHKL